MTTKIYYVAREKGMDWTVIGLGNSKNEALAEPIMNGYDREAIEVELISEEQYKKYLNMYT